MHAEHHKAIHHHLVKAGYKKSHATKMVSAMKKVAKEHGMHPGEHEKEKKVATAKMHEGKHGGYKAMKHHEGHRGRGRPKKA